MWYGLLQEQNKKHYAYNLNNDQYLNIDRILY